MDQDKLVITRKRRVAQMVCRLREYTREPMIRWPRSRQKRENQW